MNRLESFCIVLLVSGYLIGSAFGQQPEYYDTYNETVKKYSEGASDDEPLSVKSSEILKGMTLHVIPQTHIDLAWWWRYDPHTVDVVVSHTLETAFANMEKFPDYTFTFLQTPAIEPLEERHPDLFYKMRYYVHNEAAINERLPNPGPSGLNGRLAIGSGTYCEFDGSLPCGESLVRQCVYGKRYFKRHFGIDVKTAWFQDAWTHPWTLPQILKKSGIDSYMYTRPRPSEKFMIVPDSLREEYLATYANTQDDKMFWWESPDGSRVFAYKPLNLGGENLPDVENLHQYLLEINSQYGVVDGLTLIGVGNHGGGAIQADVERMRQVMQQRGEGAALAEMKFSTPERFVSAIKSKGNDLPVINDELYPTIRGIYTTASEIKSGNRHSENLLLTLEKFASIAKALDGYVYPQAWLKTAWESVMLTQFHDTISGTDVEPSIDDALSRYARIATEGKAELDKVLHSIAGRINTDGKGMPIIVFNPHSWERTDPVQVELQLHKPVDHIRIRSSENKRIPAQIIEQHVRDGVCWVKILFIAQVPSLGYAVYWAEPAKSAESIHALKAGTTMLENEFFKVEVDPTNGVVKRIIDKQAKREVLSQTENGHCVQIFEDHGDAEGFLISPKGFGEYYLWNDPQCVDQVEEVNLVESGAVRAALQIKMKFQLARFIQRIYLYAGIPRIELETVLDWNGKNKMVKAAFALNVRSDSATYEIPYGTIARPSIGEEQVAQKWVDISDDGYGVSLLNDSRYGHDITPNSIRLSLLRSPDHPVYATDEKGIHQVRYALYPHQGDWREAQTMRRGYEFNDPLIGVSTENHPGDLPVRHSFVTVEGANVIISALKKAEDSDDLILRLYESDGKDGIGKIGLSPFIEFNAVHLTDLLENELACIDHDDHQFELNIGRYAIESCKLISDKY
ncbi:MAG: alpha-mannosidase [Calditrichaeota bacterium]|nr:MAG: alpha-mannosidase [Calditrichota bacterium]